LPLTRMLSKYFEVFFMAGEYDLNGVACTRPMTGERASRHRSATGQEKLS
jgi:hypothetical protein